MAKFMKFTRVYDFPEGREFAVNMDLIESIVPRQEGGSYLRPLNLHESSLGYAVTETPDEISARQEWR